MMITHDQTHAFSEANHTWYVLALAGLSPISNQGLLTGCAEMVAAK